MSRIILLLPGFLFGVIDRTSQMNHRRDKPMCLSSDFSLMVREMLEGQRVKNAISLSSSKNIADVKA